MLDRDKYFKIDELVEYLPHRKPMVWIDYVRTIDSSSGESLVELKTGSLYFQDRKLITSAYIEFIAQSYGYLKVLEARSLNKKIKLAFLSSVDMFTLLSKMKPEPDETLRVTIETKKNLHPIYVIIGKVYNYNQNNLQLCEMKIKGFALFEGEEYEK